MANIMDYLDWRGDLTFAAAPFNEVDGLILAMLSYLNFSGVVLPPGEGRGVSLQDAAARYFSLHAGDEAELGVLVPGKIPDLLCAAAHSARFGRVRLCDYSEQTDAAREQQFAALTAEVGDGSVYIACRGTDDTIVGWKEDLNLSYLAVIPSQTRALEYLTRAARKYPAQPLRIGGHSKGGNLAVYAAVHASAAVQSRIAQVYNYDGPGFVRPLTGTAEHARIAPRIRTVVPQSSVVGRLLEHEENAQIVRADADGVLQHNGFTWQVCRDRFVYLDEFSREGKVFDETIESWAATLAPRQREVFADALYTVLTATGAKTLSDLSADRLGSAAAALKTYSNLDRETRRALSGSLGMLLRLYTRTVAEDVQKNDLEPRLRWLEEQRGRIEERTRRK